MAHHDRRLIESADPAVRLALREQGLYEPRIPAWRRLGFRRIDRNELNTRCWELMCELPKAARDALPYNLGRGCREPEALEWPYSHSKPQPAAEIRAEVRETVRFAGWIGAAAQFPVVVRFIQRTQSHRGVNSPHTLCDLCAVSRRWSPGAFARWLRKVIRRADAILRPWGLRVSWVALAELAQAATEQPTAATRGRISPQRIGRAALCAAAATVHQYFRGLGRFPNELQWVRPFTRRQAIAVLSAARMYRGAPPGAPSAEPLVARVANSFSRGYHQTGILDTLSVTMRRCATDARTQEEILGLVYGPRGADDRVSIVAPNVFCAARCGAIIHDRGRGRQQIVQVVVTCPSTGLRHHLTVPPFFLRPLLAGETAADRVRAAVAWTWGLWPDEYRPEVES